MRARTQHIATLESMNSTADPGWPAWADNRLDRWIVDWTLRTGRIETASMLAQEKGIEVTAIRFPPCPDCLTVG